MDFVHPAEARLVLTFGQSDGDGRFQTKKLVLTVPLTVPLTPEIRGSSFFVNDFMVKRKTTFRPFPPLLRAHPKGHIVLF